MSLENPLACASGFSFYSKALRSWCSRLLSRASKAVSLSTACWIADCQSAEGGIKTKALSSANGQQVGNLRNGRQNACGVLPLSPCEERAGRESERGETDKQRLLSTALSSFLRRRGRESAVTRSRLKANLLPNTAGWQRWQPANRQARQPALLRREPPPICVPQTALSAVSPTGSRRGGWRSEALDLSFQAHANSQRAWEQISRNTNCFEHRECLCQG